MTIQAQRNNIPYHLLGLLLLAGIQCSSASPSLRSRNLIIGGNTAPVDRFPYYVALKDIEGKIQCGGTLIAPDIVLTAAHCRNSNLVHADVGKYSISDEQGIGEQIEILNPFEMMSSGNWSTVRNLERSNATILDASGFVHPEHDIDARTYDIMLLKLARPAANSTLVKINTNSTVPVKEGGGRNEITIIGFGSTVMNSMFPNTPSPDMLKQVHVDFLPYDQCIDYENYNLDYKYELLPHMICTEGAGIYGDRGQCYGDSGGPYIMMGDTPDEDVQVGVVSWAVNCANSLFPMVGSRISHSLHFVKEVTCSMSAFPPADLCMAENNSVNSTTSEEIQARLIPDGVRISVRIFSDPYGHELKWRITDLFDDSTVYANAPYGQIVGDHSFQDVIVPAGGNLRFKIDDAADDGIYGDSDAILYEIVYVDAAGELPLVEGNGQFSTSREETFRVPLVNDEYLALVRAVNVEDTTDEVPQFDGATAELDIYIDFADYHEDLSWKVTSLDGTRIFASKRANTYRYGDDVTESLDLPAGDYKFTISDRHGTDDYRAFKSYKLSYFNRQQRNSLGGGETLIYESVGQFQSEESTHNFTIPVSATYDADATTVEASDLTSSQEVIIEDALFLEEAKVALCGGKKDGEFCTANADCCSSNCMGMRCRAKKTVGEVDISTYYGGSGRDRMGNKYNSRRGVTRA